MSDEIERKIISMFGLGMSHLDIAGRLHDLLTTGMVASLLRMSNLAWPGTQSICEHMNIQRAIGSHCALLHLPRVRGARNSTVFGKLYGTPVRTLLSLDHVRFGVQAKRLISL